MRWGGAGRVARNVPGALATRLPGLPDREGSRCCVRGARRARSPRAAGDRRRATFDARVPGASRAPRNAGHVLCGC